MMARLGQTWRGMRLVFSSFVALPSLPAKRVFFRHQDNITIRVRQEQLFILKQSFKMSKEGAQEASLLFVADVRRLCGKDPVVQIRVHASHLRNDIQRILCPGKRKNARIRGGKIHIFFSTRLLTAECFSFIIVWSFHRDGSAVPNL